MNNFSNPGLKRFFYTACLCAGAALLPAEAADSVFFDFVDGGGFDDPAAIGSSMTLSNITMTTVDLIGQDGSLNSTGAAHRLNIQASVNSLAVNDENNPLGVSNESRDFNPGEGWVMSFSTNVNLVEIDLASQGTDTEMTISSSAFPDFVLYGEGDGSGGFSLSNTYVAAGTEITFQMTSTTNASDVGLRIDSITVEPVESLAATFSFLNGTAFDNAGIGTTMTANGITLETVELIGADGSRGSTNSESYHRTNIFDDSRGLAVYSQTDGSTEAKDFNDAEAWVFAFGSDVYLNEVDLRFVGDESMTLSIDGGTSFDMGSGGSDIFDLGDTYVSAGTEITIQGTLGTPSVNSITVESAPSAPTETASGTPYVWLDMYYTGLVSAADYAAAESADSDGDGMSGREEYVAGTVPTNAASLLQVNTAGAAGTNQVVSWQSVTGKYYSVMVDTNLAAVSNGWSTTANNIPGLENQTSFTTTVSGAESAFFKVGIEKREIYLLIGQSNMAGRGPIEEEDEGEIEGCELFNFDEEWEAATNPLNQYSTIRKDLDLQQLNPGYGFALRMREEYPDITLGLVVNARGGTSITDWEKGDDYYEAAVARVEAALADDDCRLAGILWHQGESNSSLTNSYMTYLTTMIEDFRADFGEPDLPFVAGMLEQDDVTETVKDRPINDYIVLLPTMLDHTAVATTEDLTTLDGTHFDSASQRELGRRYAEALLSLEE